MIDIKLIRENPDRVAEKVRSKGIEIDIPKIAAMDEEYRALQKQTEDLQAHKHKVSEEIALLNGAEKQEAIARAKTIDSEQDQLLARQSEVGDKLQALMALIPNLPADDVKVGKNEAENEEMRRVGEPRKFEFPIHDHLALGELLGMVDMERGAKVSGARFAYLTGAGAYLEQALLHYALDVVHAHGFTFVIPPVLISKESMWRMGYIEHGGEQEIYHIPKDDLVLIGTAEQTIGPMHANEILNENDLPLRYVGFSPCFRREAGAYGKDTRGMMRVHQFNKVELFSFATPEQSDHEHKFFLALEERLMQGLGIPYRVIKMCSGELGTQAARKFDVEAWIPSEGRYRETHSTSNCTDFQARRLRTRYRTREGKNRLVHTVNGTAFAMSRIPIAILENFQNSDGSVEIPAALRPYMRGIEKIELENRK